MDSVGLTIPGEGDVRPLVEYGRTGGGVERMLSGVSLYPTEVVIPGIKTPVARATGSFGYDISSVGIGLAKDPSGKGHGGKVVQQGGSGKGNVVVRAVEVERSSDPTEYPVGIRLGGEAVEGTVDVVARRVAQDRAIGLVEGPVGDQTVSDARDYCGIVAVGTGDVFVPVVKAVAVVIPVPGNVYVDAGLVSVKQQGVETACRTVPIPMMSVGLADLPTGIEVAVAVAVPEGLDLVLLVFRELHGIRSRAVGQGDRVDHHAVEFCVDDDRSGHGTEIIDGPRNGRVLVGG